MKTFSGTDISVEKLLGVVVRYFSLSKSEFVTTFLGLIDLNGGKADDLLDGLERLIKVFDLNMGKLVAIGSDNSPTMIGVNKGLYKKIKEKYDLKNLILIRCVCHSLQLAVCSAADKHFPPALNFLVKETHNWFAYSTVRQKLYSKIYKTINSDSSTPKIPMVAPTRWLSIEKAVKIILEMWLELKTHFNVVNEKSFESLQLKIMYNDTQNLVYITYLASVLAEVQKVNLAFEARNADQTKLFNDLFRLLQNLTNKIIVPVEDFDYMKDDIDPVLNVHCYLGYSFEKTCCDNNIVESDKAVIKQKLINFTKALIYEIRAKLPSNFKILKQISLFSVDNIFSSKIEDILKFIKEFINDQNEIEEFENCISNLKLCNWNKRERTELFWIEVHNFKNSVNENPFIKLSTFVLDLLTLPYSNAEVERVFSVMNLVKSKIRNKINLNSVNSIIHIKYGLKMKNECCNTYKIPPIVCSKINSNETYKKSKFYLETVLWPDVINETEHCNILFENEQF